MLNEEKIKLMISLSLLEKKEGKNIELASCYFQKDYLQRKLFRFFIGYSFCFMMFVFLWAICSLDQMLGMLEENVLVEVGGLLLIYYIIGLGLYLSITYTIYKKRYIRAKRVSKIYFAKLQRLKQQYMDQNKRQ